MARKLKDLDIEEISLVDAGAVRKTFYIKKQRRSLMDLIDILKDMLGPDTELSDDEVKKAKELTEDAAKAIAGALKILNKYKDDMPDDVLAAIKTLAKYASYGYPAKKSADVDFVVELTDIEKAGARLSKATIEELKKAIEILRGIIGEREENLKKGASIDLDKLPPELKARLERLQRWEEDQIRKQKEAEEREREELKKKIQELTDTVKKLARGEPVSKQLDDDDDDDPGPDDEKPLTKAELAKLSTAELRKLADKGVIDLWPSLTFERLVDTGKGKEN